VKNVLVGKGVGVRWVEGANQAISRSKEFWALFWCRRRSGQEQEGRGGANEVAGMNLCN